ncbi:MAG: thioredoxin domain-containing protein [Sinobacteraceae bacterium]|nr:thioredoxin domain-containing protein [Nevskiaceae bacterium]
MFSMLPVLPVFSMLPMLPMLRVLLTLLTCAVAVPALALDGQQRRSLVESFDTAYDEAHAGWGSAHKYLDAAALNFAYAQLDAGDQTAIHKIRRTLDANHQLIDPVWGGVYEYAALPDWQHPSYSKLLRTQADNLLQYSEAYARWHRPADLAAAQQVQRYLTGFLAAPDGGFYSGQYAEFTSKTTAEEFYARDAAGRRALGMPRLDTQESTASAGWTIEALCKYHDVTGDAEALSRAVHAADWALQERHGNSGAAFGHLSRNDGVRLDDNAAMAAGFIALYRSTGDRHYLQAAVSALHFIDSTLRDARGGYLAMRTAEGGHGRSPEATREVLENAHVARTANMVFHYTGVAVYRQLARYAMQYLDAVAAASPHSYQPAVLLADHELASLPIHLTIVGGKNDRSAQALHAAALRYPADYLQIDWWDRSEGELPDPTISYPVLPRAAAFACTANACSTPVYDPQELQERVRAILN